jgi:hypothetical protein
MLVSRMFFTTFLLFCCFFTGEIFESAMTSFRKYCVNSTQLPVELHIVFRDLVEKHGKKNCLKDPVTQYFYGFIS